jgi:hypothetical protein
MMENRENEEVVEIGKLRGHSGTQQVWIMN